MRVISRLRLGESADSGDWEELWSAGPWMTPERRTGIEDWLDEVPANLADLLTSGIGAEQDVVASALGTWLRLGGVHAEARWSIRPRLELRTGGLFGTLGLMLLSLPGEAGGVALCQSCGEPLVPTRRLVRHERGFWCEQCRASGASRRAASRASYQRRSADPSFREREAARRRSARARQV